MADTKVAPVSTYAPLPWKGDRFADYIYAADGTMVCQIRGWGHLTGKGGGLGLSEDQAVRTQEERQALIVSAVNAHDDLLTALRMIAMEFCIESHRRGRICGGEDPMCAPCCAKAAIAKAEGLRPKAQGREVAR